MSLTLASTILSGIGTGFGILSAGHNAYSQAQANRNNLAFAKEQFDYQKELNRLTMAREDNAVQRRVADLESAGFNKRLALGASADVSSMTAGSASAGNSGANLDPSSAIASLTGIIGQIQQIRSNDSQLSIASKQKELMNLDILLKAKEAGILDAEQAKRWSEVFLNNLRQEEIRSNITESGSISDLNRSKKLEQDYRNKEWESGRHPDRSLQPFSVSGTTSGPLGSTSFSSSFPSDYLDKIIDDVYTIISTAGNNFSSKVRAYVKKSWPVLKNFFGAIDSSFEAAVEFLTNQATMRRKN